MKKIRKRIVADEHMQPVAVQIDYADWLELERLLGLQPSGNGAADSGVRDLNELAGRLELREDPLQCQKRLRNEWE